MSVQVIPATKTINKNIEDQNLRIAAYCRVSTDDDSQETSFEGQCKHFTDVINNHRNWILVDIYADEGISGTSTAKREDFISSVKIADEKVLVAFKAGVAVEILK